MFSILYLTPCWLWNINRLHAFVSPYCVVQVDVARQELFENLNRLAKLQASACALQQAVQHHAQLYNKVSAENARLRQQEAVLKAELHSCEVGT